MGEGEDFQVAVMLNEDSRAMCVANSVFCWLFDRPLTRPVFLCFMWILGMVFVVFVFIPLTALLSLWKGTPKNI